MKALLSAKIRKKYWLIGVVSTAILLTMGYSFYLSERMINKYSPLIEAAMEIKLEATIAHLWFEELLSGDPDLNFATVSDHVERSLWYANAMLAGGQTSENTYLPIDDPAIREGVLAVIGHLRLYRELTVERHNISLASGRATDIDQQYDEAFKAFIHQADQLEALVQKKIERENKIYQSLETLLLVIVFLLCSLFILAQVRHDRRHEADLAKISREVEERKIVEEKLSDLNDRKDEFITLAAHELRSPLTVISSCAELLLNYENFAEEEKVACLQNIQEKALVQARIIDEFLDVSRLESGQPLTIERSPVAVAEITRQVVQQLQKENIHYHLRHAFSDDSMQVNADAGRLYQVFENLIGNAIKYSPRGSTIEIKGEKHEGSCKITVVDQGIGIAADQQELVFQKYYRADPEENPVKGLGIGLYFVKNIVELHGGRIWIESRPGDGTRISFTVPLVEA